MLRSLRVVQRVAGAKRASRRFGGVWIAKRSVVGHNPANAAPANPYKAESRERERSAMEMINSIPPIVVDGRVAACDGGSGPLGHPRIFINTDPATLDKAAPCGYCGLRFVAKGTVLEQAKTGRVIKRGIDYILPEDVESYVLGEKKQ